jgi:hypothetical protein
MPEWAAQKFCISVRYLRGKYINCCTDYQPKAKKFVRHFMSLSFKPLSFTDQETLYLSGQINRQNIRILRPSLHINLLQVQGTVPKSVHVVVLYPNKTLSSIYSLPKSL